MEALRTFLHVLTKPESAVAITGFFMMFGIFVSLRFLNRTGITRKSRTSALQAENKNEESSKIAKNSSTKKKKDGADKKNH
mmetsp:Transcript_15052/g.26684  ORF Transcript_15052/g.26684 Transcript_15052/m.26684 type:complete len:81 (+) Transcript_15052:45-287(+)